MSNNENNTNGDYNKVRIVVRIWVIIVIIITIVAQWMNSTSGSNFGLNSLENVNYMRVASNQFGHIYSRRAKYYLPNKVIIFPNFNFVLNNNCGEFDLIKKYLGFKVEYIKETEEIDEKKSKNGEKQAVRTREAESRLKQNVQLQLRCIMPQTTTNVS